MDRNKTSLLGSRLAMVAIVAATAIAGCAQSQPDIDRVQPDYFKKSWLDGEWYFRDTVVDAPALSATTFPGAQRALERGIFEVQEDFLYFYRTYEFATGTETLGQSADVDTPLVDKDGKVVTTKVVVNGVEVDSPVYVYRGAPVAKFPIMSHFDIMRQYNSSTGEEYNVVVENGADRPWYQREYMRVDWSGTQLGADGTVGGPGVPDLRIAITPKSSGGGDEKPVFDWAGDPEESMLNYFDYKSRYIFAAAETYYEGFGMIPLCWFYPWAYGQSFECSSEEVGVRFSFKRFTDSDYVPWDYDDEELDHFGYYRAERAQYDEKRGITYAGVSRRMMRQRIWENYERREDGTLDYATMTPKPIVYYLSPEFPRDLVPGSIEIAKEWSAPFVETVEFLTGKKPAHDMVILCENNLAEAKLADAQGLPTAVWQADDTTNPNASFCNVTDEPKRVGDIRYSLLASVNQPIFYGLLGYGPPSVDPITGEVISSNAYAYTGVMKRSAQRALEAIEMMAGVRTFREIESGSYVKSALLARRLKKSGTTGRYSSQDIQEIVATTIKPSVASQISAGALPKDNGSYTQMRLNMLKNNPELEELLIGPDVRQVLKDPTLATSVSVTQELLDKTLAPRNWATAADHRERDVHDHNHAITTVFMEEFADNAILGLVREYGQRYNQEFCTDFHGQFDKIFDWKAFNSVGDKCDGLGAVNSEGWVCKTVNKEVDGGTTERRWVNVCTVEKLIAQLSAQVELLQGYNPNLPYDPPSPLYENSKSDALNGAVVAFRSKLDEMREQVLVELWQLIYKGVQLHEFGHNLGLRHNFEASTDALNFGEEYWELKMAKNDSGEWVPTNLWQRDTENQTYNKIRELQVSTVMDYGAKFNGRNKGLGLYDAAAVKYGYGGIVEVFDQTPDMDGLAPYVAEPNDYGNTDESMSYKNNGERLEAAFRKVHHTSYLKYFGNSLEALHKRTNMLATDLAKPNNSQKVEVPYRFCSDELAGMTPTCQRWDDGVDPFEIVINAADDYETYWPLNGYSHDSATWFPDQYLGSVERAFMGMRTQLQTMVLLMAHYNKNGWWAKNVGNGVEWQNDINGGLTYQVAARESYNVIANAFGRPAEGRFGFNPQSGRFEPINYLSTLTYYNQVELTQEQGARPFYAAFDYEGYMSTPYAAGSIYDRIAAYVALADPSVTPMFLDNLKTQAGGAKVDVESLVSYYSVFPNEMLRLYGSLMTSDESQFGWWACQNSNGQIIAMTERDYFKNSAPAGCTQPIYPESFSVFPNAKYRIPLLSAYYGMSLLASNYDQSFVNTSRICYKGTGECIATEGTDVVEAHDPLSGRIFVASRIGGDDVYDAAYELVAGAKALLESPEFKLPDGSFNLELWQQNYELSENQFLIGRLELIRGMYEAYATNPQ